MSPRSSRPPIKEKINPEDCDEGREATEADE